MYVPNPTDQQHNTNNICCWENRWSTSERYGLHNPEQSSILLCGLIADIISEVCMTTKSDV